MGKVSKQPLSISLIFTFTLQEITLAETPTLMTILDGRWSPNSPSHDILVCIGYKNHWDIVNGRTGFAQHLHTVEGIKTKLVTALDLYEDQEIQLLLCYNRKLLPNGLVDYLQLVVPDTCHFQKINEENSNSDFDFHWNAVPTDIGELMENLYGSLC